MFRDLAILAWFILGLEVLILLAAVFLGFLRDRH